MALVDYDSSSSEDPDWESKATKSPPVKRPKTSPTVASGVRPGGRSTPATPASELPPLPPAFHDLYASTVRQSTVDDPTLHQGRTRQIPHVVGNWPSHLYVEWHPSRTQHDMLIQLVGRIEEHIGGEFKLHNFLTSDLGATLPLHISLSRPIVLSSANKDQFLEKITTAIRSCGTGQFAVSPQKLSWYTSPDSNRTFLILQVSSRSIGENEEFSNPKLMKLLEASNRVVANFNQPILYQNHRNEPADHAFHISIGWMLGFQGDQASLDAIKTFEEKQFQSIRAWDVEVSSVKAKIGNVVSRISLKRDDSFASSRQAAFSPFGL